ARAAPGAAGAPRAGPRLVEDQAELPGERHQRHEGVQVSGHDTEGYPSPSPASVIRAAMAGWRRSRSRQRARVGPMLPMGRPSLSLISAYGTGGAAGGAGGRPPPPGGRGGGAPPPGGRGAAPRPPPAAPPRAPSRA